MKLLRRVASALTLAAAYATVFRIRGSGGTPPQHGGWRPLSLPALDALDEPAVGAGPIVAAAVESPSDPASPTGGAVHTAAMAAGPVPV